MTYAAIFLLCSQNPTVSFWPMCHGTYLAKQLGKVATSTTTKSSFTHIPTYPFVATTRKFRVIVFLDWRVFNITTVHYV